MSVDVTQFPFLPPNGTIVGMWLEWDLSMGPLTFSFPSQVPIGSVWVPDLPGVITVLNGDADTGVPLPYETQPAGAELIPIPEDINEITLETPADVGTIFVYFSSANFDPFRIGPIAAVVTTVNATLPVLSSGGPTPTISLQLPLAVEYGGSGSDAPSLVAGTGIEIQGDWPNQTISALAAGTVISVTASAPLSSSGGETPNISMEVPLPQEYGGTGTTTPGDVDGPGIGLSGTWPNQTISNDGVISLNSETGALSIVGIGGIAIAEPSDSEIEVDGSALVENVTSADGSITVDRTGQTVDLSLVTSRVKAVIVNEESGSSSGSFALATLPGDSSQMYALIAWGTTSFHDESQTLTITGGGSGVTWSGSPATFGNGMGGSTAWQLFGTAVGGQTPSIAWSQTDSVGGQPFRGVLLALPV